jgi:hypothetical protein
MPPTSFLLKERWQAATSARLQTYQQMDEEEPQCVTFNPTDD